MTEPHGQGARETGESRIIRLLSLKTPCQARTELERIGVDPAGIGLMLPKLDSMQILVPNVRPAAANILKQEMLSLGGDAAVARGTVACSIEQTDLLLLGTAKQIQGLIEKLKKQPFGLSKLAEQLLKLLASVNSPPAVWQTARRTLSLERPLIMGILNITPDSFSDGGRYASTDLAVSRAVEMEQQGADILDIGAESTRPGASPVSAEEEKQRLLPVIEQLAKRITIPVSVDTWKADVADASLSCGAEIINDISGLNFDPEMGSVCARHQAGLVLMHTRGTPQTMQQNTVYNDLMGEVSASLADSVRRATESGNLPDRLVIDPGIGFAKNREGNLELLRRLGEFRSIGLPLLVGTSRKAFIGTILGKQNPDERLFGTAATVALAVANGASIIRVHDVAAMRDVALMAHCIAS
jgi:dihydropteroate synthase